ncbi:MAG: gliding motility protein GldN, partial [Parabacteroides sp.]
REQDRIEGQLVTFEKSLWLKPDSSQLANNTGKAKRVKSTATLRGVKASTAKETKLKVTKQPEAKKSESSSAVRSVRRRR